MKKVLIGIIVLVSIFFISGCNDKKTEEKIDKTAKVDNNINEKLSSIKDFSNLDVLNDNTLETQLGINRNFVISHSIRIDLYGNTDYFYIVIKPKEEYKEIVQNAVQLYINRSIEESDNKEIYNNVLKKEYKDYYIYVLSSDNNSVYNIIENNLK